MNILLISTLFPSSENDRRTKAVLNLVKYWGKRGVKLLVIKPVKVSWKRYLFSKSETCFIEDVKILEVPYIRLSAFKYDMVWLMAFHIIFLMARRSFFPDIVISHFKRSHIFSYPLTKILRKPLVLGLHQTDIRKIREHSKILTEKELRYANLIACRSFALEKQFLFLYPEYRKKVITTNSGIEREEIEGLEFMLKKAASFLASPKKMITVARLKQ